MQQWSKMTFSTTRVIGGARLNRHVNVFSEPFCAISVNKTLRKAMCRTALRAAAESG